MKLWKILLSMALCLVLVLSTDDAVYLLLHVMFGAKDYPLTA